MGARYLRHFPGKTEPPPGAHRLRPRSRRVAPKRALRAGHFGSSKGDSGAGTGKQVPVESRRGVEISNPPEDSLPDRTRRGRRNRRLGLALVAVLVVSCAIATTRDGRQHPTDPPSVQAAAPAFHETVEPTPPPAAPLDPGLTVTETENTSRVAPPPPVRSRTTAPTTRRQPAPRPGVSATTPVRIEVSSIGVSAPIDPLGLNADGSLAVPKDFRRAGYYTGRSIPGEIGPAIIVAHVGSKSGPAVFAHLRDVRPGAEVVVTRADGSRIVFVVDRVEQHPKNALPTAAVYGPTSDATLRLITCGGAFDRSTGHYVDNYIVFAWQVGRP